MNRQGLFVPKKTYFGLDNSARMGKEKNNNHEQSTKDMTHHSHAVVEERLSEDEKVEIGVDSDLGEDGQHGDGIN